MTDPSPPYRTDPQCSHQIWIWYRLHDNPQELHLLFREQFDFSDHNEPVDTLATNVTDFLAILLTHYRLHSWYRFNQDSAYDFWKKAITTYCRLAKNQGLYIARSIAAAEVLDQRNISKTIQVEQLEWLRLPIQARLEQILLSGQLTKNDQVALNQYASRQALCDREQELLKQVFQNLENGRIKVLD
jgi:hypothetical protein